MPKPLDVCLTIAGSDPSGGAGIQADLKTFTVLKVYGCAVMTCLTAQNSSGVQAYQTVDRSFLHQQIRLVLEDLPVTHIKIGMVGSSGAAQAIGEALKDFRGQVIYDPVLKASDGSALIQSSDIESLYEHVFSRATVITPNLPELQTIVQRPCLKPDEAVLEAAPLFNRFPRLEAIVITGGHFSEESSELNDFLILKPDGTENQGEEVHKACHQKVDTRNTHGTGCTFSSAYTAYHKKSNDHKKAFFKAVEFMDLLLRKSEPYDTGIGHGGLVHYLFPE